MISGFRLVAENCTLLGHYAASNVPRCVMTQKTAVLKKQTNLTKVQGVFTAVQFPCSCITDVTLNTSLSHNTCILLVIASTCFGGNFWPFLIWS